MSATFDTDEFAYYFRSVICNEIIPAPIIFVSKESMFNINTYYADQLKLLGDVRLLSY